MAFLKRKSFSLHRGCLWWWCSWVGDAVAQAGLFVSFKPGKHHASGRAVGFSSDGTGPGVIAGGLDISVGSVMGLASVVAAMREENGVEIGILSGVAVGRLAGHLTE